MDHVRTAVAWLKKNYFWVSCGLIVLVGLSVWWVVTSDLSGRTEENKKEIASNFDKMSNVSRIPQHPNPISKENMETLIRRLKQSVQIGWEKQFDQQGKEIFVWPDFLSEKAVDKLKTLRPIEQYVGFPMTPRQEQLIPSEWRYDYNQKIEDELEKLADKIGAEWNPSAVASGGGAFDNFGGGEGGAIDNTRPTKSAKDKDIVVQWNPANQGAIRNRFDWTERPERAPTTIEMLYAQEDLWVLKSIMDVVKDTNGNANAAYNAVIRQVDDIQIGRNASAKEGKIMRLASENVGGEGLEEDPYAVEAEGFEGEGMLPEGEGFLPEGEGGFDDGGLEGGQQVALIDPASYRYVDKNFKPLSATTLRESANNAPGAEATVEQAELAYLAVAKRMPIRVRLRIDQRKLGKFLTACGNAPLTIEVRQVRVFTRQPIPGGAVYTGGGEFGGGGGGSQIAEMFGGAGGGGGEFGGLGGANRTNMPPALDPKYPFDVNVEVYGIVYIYNPVAEEWFNVPEEGNGEEGVAPPLTSINRSGPTG